MNLLEGFRRPGGYTMSNEYLRRQLREKSRTNRPDARSRFNEAMRASGYNRKARDHPGMSKFASPYFRLFAPGIANSPADRFDQIDQAWRSSCQQPHFEEVRRQWLWQPRPAPGTAGCTRQRAPRS